MVNRLADEHSPYLLQHKDNPVDWYPWGEEAFARSRAEGKPIFLSIGYATCHWCHVMERESFESERIAEALNRDFVAIKVDREERPDVDDIYMSAVQTMTGSGGWPLSVFLTPDRRPFYGGTYFPPDDRWGRPGFLSLLSSVANAWTTRRQDMETSAAELFAHLSDAAAGAPAAGTAGPEVLDVAMKDMVRQFDAAHGGFGGAPKFPPAMRLELLIRRFARTGDPEARAMAETTLTKMAEGGLYDHVGGGFHRYSVDGRWLIPHFEKMLYDNAMLARVYLLAGRAFADPGYDRVARETLDYLLREMTPEEGGFFAAQDADSGGEEGTFYSWTPAELEEALGRDTAAVVSARFGVTKAGNFEGGRTVFSVVRGLTDIARETGKSAEEIAATLAAARDVLYEVRRRRVAPATDDKLLTDWTSLAISAFALAGRLLREPRYEAAARRAADRILSRCRRGGELLHRERGGEAGIPGFASDYAYLIEALLDLYEATFEARYFREAVGLQRDFEARFADTRGGYALSTTEHDGLIFRPREILDAATPSSNSVAAMNLLRLHAFTGDAAYRDGAEGLFSTFSAYLQRASSGVPRLLCALDWARSGSREVVIAGEKGRRDFEALRDAVFASPALNRVVAHADAAGSLEGVSPLVEGRSPENGAARAWVCEDFACKAPTADPAELAAALHG
ncbi:MAG: thioredoxin domain-containing protein [Acidobacteriota bacterium]